MSCANLWGGFKSRAYGLHFDCAVSAILRAAIAGLSIFR
jgi:hypothetical protein